MINKYLASAATAVFCTTAGATFAATFSIVGGNDFVLSGPGNGNYNPTGAEASSLDGSTVKQFSAGSDGGSIGGGLAISGSSDVRVTFLGKEAAYRNLFVELESDGNVQSLSNRVAIGSFFEYWQSGPGFVNFQFVAPTNSATDILTNGGTSASMLLDLGLQLSRDQMSAYVLFGDGGANNDKDLDDMVMRLDIVPNIPLPASSLLLLGGLGGLLAMRRRNMA